MHSRTKLWVILAMVGVFLFVGTTWAQDLKARMEARLPVIKDLKVRGVVGENNQGFLELRPGQTEKQDVVNAENQDRQAVYGQIAKQAGTDPKLVGQRRAAQIAEKAAPGEWIQDAGGQWHQK
ncbi:MAG: YdbL family protein [Desulfobacteraceae bacterium]|nr:YdbL family protein [Desulfobacteraceae bacterium]